MFRPALVVASLGVCLAAPTGHAESGHSPGREITDEALAREVPLAWVERLALAQHPALRESNERTAAARARVAGAQRLPDPELKYEQWAVPLSRPYALHRADTLMFGLRQALPAPGERAARGRIANEEAQLASRQREVLERDLLLRVRRAYFEYYAADRTLRVHLEHVGIAEQVVHQVRADYEVGRGKQEDVLKALVELSRLQNDLAEVRRERESARLMLNALMARPPDAPLGPPATLARPTHVPSMAELDAMRLRNRPELSAAQLAIQRAEATLDLAKLSARRPSFMVGADYWLMPTADAPHAYGAMVAMSLPWLSRGRQADVREAEHAISAERYAAESVEIETAFQLHDAIARLHAANATLEVIEREVLPQAEKSLESSRAAFAAGQASLLALLDALRAYFQIRLEHTRALTRATTELASVEFASGAALVNPAAEEKRP